MIPAPPGYCDHWDELKLISEKLMIIRDSLEMNQVKEAREDIVESVSKVIYRLKIEKEELYE